jgi:WD40 repeat protein
VNRICWHLRDKSLLCAASQDGLIRTLDTRLKKNSCVITFESRPSSAVRDIQYDPLHDYLLASVTDNGTLYVWDTRNNDSPLWKITAHSSASQTLSWNSSVDYRLATGGRDKTIKIWDLNAVSGTSSVMMRPSHVINTASSVAKIRWRPNSVNQIGCSQLDKAEIVIFDVNTPNLAACIMRCTNDVCADFEWLDTPYYAETPSPQLSLPKKPFVSTWSDWRAMMGIHQHLLSVSGEKEGKMNIHDMRNAFFPRQHISGTHAGISALGDIAFHQGAIDRVNTPDVSCLYSSSLICKNMMCRLTRWSSCRVMRRPVQGRC